MNDMIANVARAANVTTSVDLNQGLGSRSESGHWSGCLGRLQRNESDVLLTFGNYPMDIENITQGDIFFDTILTFSQCYYLKQSKIVQILSSLSALCDILVYIFLFLFSVIFVLRAREAVFKRSHKKCERLFSTGRRRRSKRNHRYIFYVLAHATRFGALKGRSLFTRILAFSLSIFALVVVHFFNSSIKTNLVVFDEPEVWKSYEDLIRDKVQPIFVQGTNTKDYFNHVANDSHEGKIWQYINSSFDVNDPDLYASADYPSIMRGGMQMMQRKRFVLTDHIVSKSMQNMACDFKSKNKEGKVGSAKAFEEMRQSFRFPPLEKPVDLDFYYLIRSDPFAKEIQKTVVYSHFFSSREEKMIKKMGRYAYEVGIGIWAIRTIQRASLFQVPFNLRDPRVDIKEECASESIVRSTSHRKVRPKLENFISLFYCYFAFCFLSLAFLANELVKVKIKIRRIRKIKDASQLKL